MDETILDYYEEQPAEDSSQAPDAPSEAQPEAAASSPPEAPEEERFTKLDPASLPDDLKPYYKSLQADYTRKMQALAQERKALQEAPPVQQPVSHATDTDWEPQFQQYAAQVAPSLGVELEPSPETAFRYEDETDDPRLARIEQMILEDRRQRSVMQYMQLQQAAVNAINEVAGQYQVSPAQVFAEIQALRLQPFDAQHVLAAAQIAKAKQPMPPQALPAAPTDTLPVGSRQRVETLEDMDIGEDDDIVTIHRKMAARGLVRNT